MNPTCLKSKKDIALLVVFAFFCAFWSRDSCAKAALFPSGYSSTERTAGLR